MGVSMFKSGEDVNHSLECVLVPCLAKDGSGSDFARLTFEAGNVCFGPANRERDSTSHETERNTRVDGDVALEGKLFQQFFQIANDRPAGERFIGVSGHAYFLSVG